MHPKPEPEPDHLNPTLHTSDVSKAETKAARQTDRMTERQKDRQKKEVLFSFIIKTKVAKNVNRMSER